MSIMGKERMNKGQRDCTTAASHNMCGNELYYGISNIFIVINIFTMSGLGEQKTGGLGEQKNTYYALAVRILSTNILNN